MGPRLPKVRKDILIAVVLLAGGLALLPAVASSAAGATITVSPATGLTNGQSVTISGSGFTPSSTGTVLECNNDTGQPTVALGAPVNQSVPVGCTGISLTALVTTTSSGGLSTTFSVITGTVGPPCGGSYLVACPSTDSAGNSPATDAGNYPCPPTTAQQAAGVTCTLAFGDQAGDQATAPISFQGQSPPTTTTSSTTSTTKPTTTTSSTTTSSTSSTTTSSTTTSTTTSSTTTTTTPTTTTTTVPCTPQSKQGTVGNLMVNVDPATCLTNGQTVTVSGSGFAASSSGSVLECNRETSQPTVTLTLGTVSETVPVSCSPITTVVPTNSSGGFSTTFTIMQGTTGPPCGGASIFACPPTDSAGNSPGADAQKYPCPPQAAGAACDLAFGDQAGEQVSVQIDFAPAPTSTTTPTTPTTTAVPTTRPATPAISTNAATTTTSTTAGPVAHAVSAPSGTAASGGTLPFTGVGPGFRLMALIAFLVLDLGYLLLRLSGGPRRLAHRALHAEHSSG